jgi:neural Wiskott-Aldrich syndrome protein
VCGVRGGTHLSAPFPLPPRAHSLAPSLPLPGGTVLSTTFLLARTPRSLSTQRAPPVNANCPVRAPFHAGPWTPPVRPVAPNHPRARPARTPWTPLTRRTPTPRLPPPQPFLAVCNPLALPLPHLHTHRTPAPASHHARTRGAPPPWSQTCSAAAIESLSCPLPQ